MKTRRCLNIAALFAATVMVGCTAPDNAARVFVEYKQVANFHDYRLAPDASVSHGAGDGMFIMYKITQIKNTGSAAQPFVFDVNKVLTVTPDHTSNETVTNANILLVGQNVTTIAVGAGQTMSVQGCFIKQALTSNPEALVSAKVALIYQLNSNQPVSMTNISANTPAAVANALPAPLQSLCSSN